MSREEDAWIMGAYDDMGWNPFSRKRKAPARRPAPRPAPFRAPTANRRRALNEYQPDSSGLAVDLIMPFSEDSFAAGKHALTLTAQPQKRFQVRRIVIDLGRDGATSAGVVRVTDLTMGADPVFTNVGRVPASMFGATAVGINIKPRAVRPGITCTLGLVVTPGPAAADTILVSASGVGPSLG